MKYCVDCGSPIPDDQGARTCSMCEGDPYHGKDGYMLRAMEEEAQRQSYERWRAELEETENG